MQNSTFETGLSILSSAHRAHGSAHTNVLALENQSEREFLIMILVGLQCSNVIIVLYFSVMVSKATPTKPLPGQSIHGKYHAVTVVVVEPLS